MRDVHLAIDLGASSGRVIAGYLNDKGMLELEDVHRFANDPLMIQDSLQWNIDALWVEILEGLRLAAGRFENIRSVGVDTWGVDYVLIDRNGQIAGPVRHYRDARNNGVIEKACEALGGPEQGRDKIFSATGLQFLQINSLIQLYSSVINKECCIEIAEHFLMMGDYFHWLLSGKYSIEATNASTSQMLDPRTKTWATDLQESLSIPTKMFQDVTAPGTVLGSVQPSVATATGLQEVPVIVPATHDTASAVLAVPAEGFAKEKPDWCFISSGTWSLMGCELASPKITPLCSELNFTNEGGVAGSTRLLKNIGGLWVFQQLRKSMTRRGETPSWESMVQDAAAATPFEIILDPDHPELAAPDDMLTAIERVAEQTGQNKPASVGTAYRAALECLALRYRACLGMLEQLIESPIKTIHIVGGGTQNELLCQMTADACNRTVIAGPVEATAIGNVAMQMIGLQELTTEQTKQAIETSRELVRSSFAVKTFQPQEPLAWNEPYERFQQWYC